MFKLMDKKIITILRKLFLLKMALCIIQSFTVNNALLQHMFVNEFDLKYVNF